MNLYLIMYEFIYNYIWSQNMKILGLQIWNIVESERISDKADSVGSLD